MVAVGRTVGGMARARCVAVLASILVFLVLSAAAEGDDDRYTLIASTDGRTQITAADYRHGLVSAGTDIAACTQFDALKGGFFLRVSMGNFTDYIIPASADTTVCDVLTSSAVQGKYRWSRGDPGLASWDGKSSPVGLASHWERGLGGAPLGFLAGTATSDRSTISFWGFDDEDDEAKSDSLNHKGGCCAHVAHESPDWRQPFQIHLSPPQDEEALYLTWVAEPTAVVLGSPVVFMVKVWNFRGEPYKGGQPSFTVNANGRTQVVSASNNRATLVYEVDLGSDEFSDLKEGEAFALTVSTSLPSLASSRSTLSLQLPILSPLAKGLRPCTSGAGVAELLHYGPLAFAIGPVSRVSAVGKDWFAADVGEAYLAPTENHRNVAEADPGLAPVTQTWVGVRSTESDGTYASCHDLGSAASQDPEVNGVLQFYAFNLYSAAAQDVVLQINVSDDFILWLDHTEVKPPAGSTVTDEADSGAISRRSTFSHRLSAGHHQALLKVFTSRTSASRAAACSALQLKVFGTGVAYSLEAPVDASSDAYKMTSGMYMYSLVHSGETSKDMLYASAIDQDLIQVHNATPRINETVVAANQLGGDDDNHPSTQRSWSHAVFYGGNILVDGGSIPDNYSYAVKYVALALYNQYDVDVAVEWQLVVRGHTEMYMDGVLRYAALEDAEADDFVTTVLTPGWHQLVVRLATARDHRWIFRFYMFFTGYNLLGALQLRHPNTMPLGARVVNDGAPLMAMLELTAKDQALTEGELAAMILYDASNQTESSITFLPEGISLSSGGGGGAAEPHFLYAYETENVSLSTADGAGLASVFEWVPTTNQQEGLWGHVAKDSLAGGYYRLWAFALYVAEDTAVNVKVDFVGGIAVWVDGALATSVPTTEGSKGVARSDAVVVEASKGWHQVLLKLQVPSTFLLDREEESHSTGPDLWLNASARCKLAHGSTYKLCPAQAYCPFGAPRLGVGLPFAPTDAEDASPNVYAPVNDEEQLFVQLSSAAPVGASSKTPQPLCSTANAAAIGGDDDDDLLANSTGEYVGCCESIRPPFVDVRFTVGEAMQGKMGYSYHRLFTVATPTITRSAAYLGLQNVSLACQTEGATIRFRFLGDTNWTTYTEPLRITHATTIESQAYLGSHASGIVSRELYVPEVITFDRKECLYAQPCPLTFTGAKLGDRASLVLATESPKEVQSFANIAKALAEPQSSFFSGVGEMDTDTLTANLKVGLPSDDSVDVQQYVVMVYDEVNGTQEGYVHMRRGITLTPSVVAANSSALFKVNTYLGDTDTVLFPQLHKVVDEDGQTVDDSYYAESECSVAVCKSAVGAYAATTGSPVTASRTFEVDLSATQRSSLTCMCVCVGCRDRLATGAMSSSFAGKRGRLVALPIHVRVLREDGAGGQEDVKRATPTSSAAGVMMVVLLPIFVVFSVMMVGVVVFYHVQHRRALSLKVGGGGGGGPDASSSTVVHAVADEGDEAREMTERGYGGKGIVRAESFPSAASSPVSRGGTDHEAV